jgi:hypothetical protein
MGRALPFPVTFWKTQNLFYEMLQIDYPKFLQWVEDGDERAAEWVRHFSLLGEKLSIRVRRE